eukprot:4522516-Amphidinium_carterae.1
MSCRCGLEMSSLIYLPQSVCLRVLGPRTRAVKLHHESGTIFRASSPAEVCASLYSNGKAAGLLDVSDATAARCLVWPIDKNTHCIDVSSSCYK